MADWIDNEIAANKEKARALGRENRESFPHATAAAYSPEHDLIVIDLENGSKFAFPPKIAQGLERATQDQLSEIELTPGGYGLLWPKLDAALSIQGLIQGVMGSTQWAKEFARKGGKTTSATKAAAARTNGSKGGRPRKPIYRIDDIVYVPRGKGFIRLWECRIVGIEGPSVRAQTLRRLTPEGGEVITPPPKNDWAIGDIVTIPLSSLKKRAPGPTLVTR